MVALAGPLPPGSLREQKPKLQEKEKKTRFGFLFMNWFFCPFDSLLGSVQVQMPFGS